MTCESDILSYDYPNELLLESMERGDLILNLSCWKQIEMEPLRSLKIAKNMLGNPNLGYLENL